VAPGAPLLELAVPPVLVVPLQETSASAAKVRKPNKANSLMDGGEEELPTVIVKSGACLSLRRTCLRKSAKLNGHTLRLERNTTVSSY